MCLRVLNAVLNIILFRGECDPEHGTGDYSELKFGGIFGVVMQIRVIIYVDLFDHALSSHQASESCDIETVARRND
jgi:hypothetical protein